MKCLPIHAGESLTRSEIDRLEAFVKRELGAKGLAWIRVMPGGEWQSPIAKFLSDSERAGIAERTGAKPGSVLFFAADEFAKANAILGRLRVDLGRQLGRVETRDWAPVLVLDFPFSSAATTASSPSCTCPFVAPHDEDLGLLDSDPARVRGTHYDVVLNGLELGSGSCAITAPTCSARSSRSSATRRSEMEARFGFMLTRSTPARHRTAASRSASTAWRCCSPARRACAT